MDRLKGKVALISGAARGQGACEAQLFVDEGACVVLGDVLDAEGQRVAESINQKAGGQRAVYVHLDVTDAGQWAQAVATAERTFGGLHVLVNNAGVRGRQPDSGVRVEDTTEAAWQRIIDINVKGVWLGMKAAIPALRRAGGGSIVNISSISGILGLPGSLAYNSSKGAVRIMTKNAALDYAAEKIRVNSVHPGFIDTPMTADLREDQRAAMIAATPVGRAGVSEDIAYGVLYLASDEATFVTGAELVIDGGYIAR